MLLPFAYTAKIAASTTAGAVVAVASVLANTDPTVTVIGGIAGIGTFAAGVFKLLSDHTAQQALRETLTDRAERAEADRNDERLAKVQYMSELAAERSELSAVRAELAAARVRIAEVETSAALLRARLEEGTP